MPMTYGDNRHKESGCYGPYHTAKCRDWGLTPEQAIARREALPWHDPDALPYFTGDEKWCRDGACKDTNWQGIDRVHIRGSECPPLKEKK